VPSKLTREFDRRVDRWLVGPGEVAPKDAVQSDPIWYSVPPIRWDAYLNDGIWGILRYLLKGLDHDSAGSFEVKPKPEGTILGKRSGYSESLGVQHRWQRLRFERDPRVWVGGPSVKMRRLVEHLCPELIGLVD